MSIIRKRSASRQRPMAGGAPSYVAPGVYGEEARAQAEQITGVATSIAAFVGRAPGGPVEEPTLISSWTDFAAGFGDPDALGKGPFMAGSYLAHAVYGFFQNGGGICWVVRLVEEPGGSEAAHRRGLSALSPIDDIMIVCMPDLQDLGRDPQDEGARALQAAMVAHCEALGPRMAILDAPPSMSSQELEAWLDGTAALDSKSATIYHPWIQVVGPLSDRALLVPPCGHVAGVWARTDSERGVHKAPANEVVRGAQGLASEVTEHDQAALNGVGVNCIRSFPGMGIRIWGARTLSSDPDWRYVNVCRLFDYIAASVIKGTEWAGVQPNDERLWRQLQGLIAGFLTTSWREGALFGATPEQAFFVRCDAETNPPELVRAGQVNIEIGIAPVKASEFIVFEISHYRPDPLASSRARAARRDTPSAS